MKSINYFVIFVLLTVMVSCTDMVESSYSSMDEAHGRDAGHGWLPSFLPSAAEEIKEVHSLDSNQVWGTFRLNGTSPPSSFCQAPSNVPEIYIGNPGVQWWPKKLKGRVISSSRMTLLRCSGADEVLIVSNDGSNRYYWVRKG